MKIGEMGRADDRSVAAVTERGVMAEEDNWFLQLGD